MSDETLKTRITYADLTEGSRSRADLSKEIATLWAELDRAKEVAAELNVLLCASEIREDRRQEEINRLKKERDFAPHASAYAALDLLKEFDKAGEANTLDALVVKVLRERKKFQRQACRLKVGLQFYADPKNWKFESFASDIAETLSPSDLGNGNTAGNRAREALADAKKISEE